MEFVTCNLSWGELSFLEFIMSQIKSWSSGVNPATTFQTLGKSAWILKKIAREKHMLQKL